MIAMVAAGCFLIKYRLTRALPSFTRPTTTWISWNNFWDAPELPRVSNQAPIAVCWRGYARHYLGC